MRWIPPRIKSEKIAIRAVGRDPAKIIAPPFVALVPLMMISPSQPPPTKAPMAVIPIATTRAFLSPAMITEIDSGNSTINKR